MLLFLFYTDTLTYVVYCLSFTHTHTNTSSMRQELCSPRHPHCEGQAAPQEGFLRWMHEWAEQFDTGSCWCLDGSTAENRLKKSKTKEVRTSEAWADDGAEGMGGETECEWHLGAELHTSWGWLTGKWVGRVRRNLWLVGGKQRGVLHWGGDSRGRQSQMGGISHLMASICSVK